MSRAVDIRMPFNICQIFLSKYTFIPKKKSIKNAKYSFVGLHIFPEIQGFKH